MTHSTVCSHCGVKLKAQEKHIGRELTCPKCRKPFTVQPPGQSRQAKKSAAVTISGSSSGGQASASPESGAEPAARLVCSACGGQFDKSETFKGMCWPCFDAKKNKRKRTVDTVFDFGGGTLLLSVGVVVWWIILHHDIGRIKVGLVLFPIIGAGLIVKRIYKLIFGKE